MFPYCTVRTWAAYFDFNNNGFIRCVIENDRHDEKKEDYSLLWNVSKYYLPFMIH